MPFPRSVESRLLLACARIAAEPRTIQELVRVDLDWRAILERAIPHGVAPLLYTNLKRVSGRAQIPTEVMAQLQRLYYGHATQNIHLYHKLREILVAFSREEIPVIVLKGAALAALIYENIALRPMGDLDLLVRGQDVDRADHLLNTLHYVPHESDRPQEWYREHHHHLAPYIARDQSLVLELHHHIIQPTASGSLPIQALWQRARPVQLASMTAFVFAPQDLLLHSCLHLSVGDGFLGRLRNLCDIAEIIRRYQEEIDWAQLLREAHMADVDKYLYYPLWLAQDMVKAEIPVGVLRELASSMGGRSMDDRVLKFITRRVMLRPPPATSPVPFEAIADVCAGWLSAKETGEKIKSVCQRIGLRLVSSARQQAPQPRSLALLYTIFVHPLYLMIRAVSRIARPRSWEVKRGKA